MTKWLQMVPWRKNCKSKALEHGSEIFCFSFTVLPKMARKGAKNVSKFYDCIVCTCMYNVCTCLGCLSMNMYLKKIKSCIPH